MYYCYCGMRKLCVEQIDQMKIYCLFVCVFCRHIISGTLSFVGFSISSQDSLFFFLFYNILFDFRLCLHNAGGPNKIYCIFASFY